MHSATPLAVQTWKLNKTVGDFSLDDINLCIPAGSLCAVLGAAGSGKTTLVKLLLGLDDPDTGQRIIFGQDIAQGLPKRRLGYAPQTDFPDAMAVHDVLRYIMFLSGQKHMNDHFPAGIFVTTDDVNSNPNADSNWKLVSWADIAAGLELTTDTAYDPRSAQAPAVVDAVSVTPQLETERVPAATDAADDPAIWIHPEDRALSLIIGTDKVNGLVTYNLDGTVPQTINLGRLNNVDLRNGFMLNGQPSSLVVATNRTLGGIEIYAVSVATRMLEDVASQPIISNVEEVYGVCIYVSPVSGKHYVFVTAPTRARSSSMN